MVHIEFTGKLVFHGWDAPWLVFGDTGANDLSPAFWELAERLKGEPTTLSYDLGMIRLGADPVSDFDLLFEEIGGGIIVKKRDGLGFSNVAAYLEWAMQAMNARDVIAIVSDEAIVLTAVDPPGTFGVYYKGEGNQAEIPPGAERTVCKIGDGKETCIFLTCGPDGFRCGKFCGPTHRLLLHRHFNGEMQAGRIGGCRILGRVAP
jgi:hypothetical protein